MTDLLPVVQVDRDAVQAFHRTMLDRLMDDVKSKRPKLGDDEGDAGTLVQAFARHRLLGHEAGRRDMREAAASVVEEYETYSGDPHRDAVLDVMAVECAAAIRNLPTQPRGGEQP